MRVFAGNADNQARGRLMELHDKDLWVVPDERRYSFRSSEEAVEEWKKAVLMLEDLAVVAGYASNAAQMAIWDARERAEVELRRAREAAVG
jgi:predicted nucleotidyltransferase